MEYTNVGFPSTSHNNYYTTILKFFCSAGYVVAIAGLAIILEVLVIVLRFLNIGLINLKSKIFLAIVRFYIFFSHFEPSYMGVVAIFFKVKMTSKCPYQ